MMVPRISLCEQGSVEWHAIRRGKPTASEADKLIMPRTGKPSASARGYANRLVAERLLNATGTTLDGLPYLERGKECEPEAVRQYEFTNDCKLIAVGFMLSPCGRYGASPDRLIADTKAGVEIKSPAAHTHLGYLLGDGLPVEYKPQVQMQLLAGDLEYVDFYSYHPRCPAFTMRTYRDEEYIGKLSAILDEFCDALDAMEAKARTLGLWQPFADLAMPSNTRTDDGIEGRALRELLAEDADELGVTPRMIALAST